LVSPGGEIVVTVLKREFARAELREMISESGLKIQRDVNTDQSVKDHVVFCSGI